MKTRATRAEKLSTTVRDKGQITIPYEIRQAAHLEVGDSVEVYMTADGILLRPRKTVDSTQAWFWDANWQAGEREASSDIAHGRLRTFDNGTDFLAELEKA